MQIRTLQCDRCGEIEATNGPGFSKIEIYGPSIVSKKFVRKEIKHLCEHCVEMFTIFMKGEPPPELVPAVVPLS